MVEMSQLESLVISSQNLLKNHVKKFLDQMKKLALAHKDNEKLIIDTQNLIGKINIMTEESHKQYWR